MEVVVERTSGLIRFLAGELSQPWMPLQLAGIVGAIALAFVINRWVEPVVEQRIRSVRNWPRMLRLLAVVLRRTRWLLAAGFLWLAAVLLRQAGVPGGPALVSVAATLVTSWALIAIASRAIRNRLLARVTALVGWMLVALGTLDLLEPTARALDVYALPLGKARISALTVAKGAALLGILLWIATFAGDFIERSLRRSSDVTPSFQVLFTKLSKLALYAVAVVGTLTTIGVDLTALTIFSGAIGLGARLRPAEGRLQSCIGNDHLGRQVDQTR
jgi:small-conductance mechanosensitive channel